MSSRRDDDTAGTDEEAVARRLIDLADHINRRVTRPYHSTRLTRVRLSALDFIVSRGRCNAAQVAQAEQVTAATITRVLDGLEATGFITRTPSKHDRRMVELEATAGGQAALLEAKAWQVQRLADDLRGLTQRDRARLAGALDTLGPRMAEDAPNG